MNLKQLQQHKTQIIEMTSAYGITNIRVFGSVVRGEAREDSDVDLLVTAPKNIGFRFYGIAHDIGKLLGCHVDIVSDKYINPLIAEHVLEEAVPL